MIKLHIRQITYLLLNKDTDEVKERMNERKNKRMKDTPLRKKEGKYKSSARGLLSAQEYVNK